MSTVEINAEVNKKLDDVRAALASEIAGKGDVCLTCSFQAEDVLLTKLAIALDPAIPVLFLDTGYHFRETYDYRDRIAREWGLNLIEPAACKDRCRAGSGARPALPVCARPLLRTAQSGTAVQGGSGLSRMDYRTAQRTGQDPRRA